MSRPRRIEFDERVTVSGAAWDRKEWIETAATAYVRAKQAEIELGNNKNTMAAALVALHFGELVRAVESKAKAA